MSTRSLNRVQLIGNLTRDPELRYTPQGTAVCTFGMATNRGWVTESGEKKEEAEFHQIVTWNKLAEICSQFLTKGRKVFIEGRLQTRQWTAQDGTARQRTEVVASDMIILDNKGSVVSEEVPPDVSTTEQEHALSADETAGTPPTSATTPVNPPAAKTKKVKEEEKVSEEVNPNDDIPF